MTFLYPWQQWHSRLTWPFVLFLFVFLSWFHIDWPEFMVGKICNRESSQTGEASTPPSLWFIEDWCSSITSLNFDHYRLQLLTWPLSHRWLYCGAPAARLLCITTLPEQQSGLLQPCPRYTCVVALEELTRLVNLALILEWASFHNRVRLSVSLVGLFFSTVQDASPSVTVLPLWSLVTILWITVPSEVFSGQPQLALKFEVN